MYPHSVIWRTVSLPIDAKIKVLEKIASDYVDCVKAGSAPETKTYSIVSRAEDRGVEQSARIAAFERAVPGPITKFAFDTRRVDQEGSRNPRKNLQYWHRSDEFIDKEDESKLNTFAKLAKVLTELKNKLGKEPEWFESYARQLYDNVFRILRVKESDLDIFRPQISYLEQLIFARYRLSMENLEKYSEDKISECILKKDEDLVGRAKYLKEVSADDASPKQGIVKDSLTNSTQESIVNAIFGANNLRKDGERTVERTITIRIVENVTD